MPHSYYNDNDRHSAAWLRRTVRECLAKRANHEGRRQMKVLIERCECELVDEELTMPVTDEESYPDKWLLAFRITIRYDDGLQEVLFVRAPAYISRLRKMFELAGADVTVDI